MNVNAIRKLAKEIRTEVCQKGYDELIAIKKEIEEYTENAKEGWTDRTKEFVEADMETINQYIESIKPVKKVEGYTGEIRRKGFKTVLKEMQGKEDPVLEAVRWFAVIYAEDTYNEVRCVKGMLTRRSYELKENGDQIEVFKGEAKVADISCKDGLVTEFEIA